VTVGHGFGGVALVRAAGLDVRVPHDGQWVELASFSAAGSVKDAANDLRRWRQPLMLGERGAVDVLADLHAPQRKAS
jgi:hypothetical protein